MPKYWIAEATKERNRGSLRAYVQRTSGSRGFVKHKGRKTIRVQVLHKLAKKPGRVGRKARLALTLRSLRK